MRSEVFSDLTRTVLQLLFMGALIVGCLWVLRPFILPLGWAATIVIASWPVFQRLIGWFGGRRGLAVAAMTVAMLLVLVVPLYLVSSTLVAGAQRIGDWSDVATTVAVPQPPGWLTAIPFAGPRLEAGWRQIAAGGPDEVAGRLLPYVQTLVRWIAGRLGGIGVILIEFLLTVLVAAILFANGESVSRGMTRFAHRVAGARGVGAAHLAAQAVRAVALGVVVTAVAQSALGGVGLALAGVPFAPVLAAVMLVLGVAQVGPFPVLLPAVIWMYSSHGALWGTALLVWSVVVGLMDTVLRPFLIRRGANLPLLLILAGVIGGLVAFGVIGLFLGPVLLAVAYTLLVAWVDDALDPADAVVGEPPEGGEVNS